MGKFDGAMPCDALLLLVAQQLSQMERHIQGFRYAGHLVIRDVSKKWSEQELWRKAADEDDMAARQEMEWQIEAERLKSAFRRALGCVASPFPGQEKLAEAVRSSLQPKDTTDV